MIDLELLQNEKALLKTEFDKLNAEIKKVEFDLGTMRANLNALHGAVQQNDKFINMLKPSDDEEALKQSVAEVK